MFFKNDRYVLPAKFLRDTHQLTLINANDVDVIHIIKGHFHGFLSTTESLQKFYFSWILKFQESTGQNNIISLGRRKRPSSPADDRRRAMTSGTVPDSAAEAAGENLKFAVGENQNSLVRSSGNDKIGSEGRN